MTRRIFGIGLVLICLLAGAVLFGHSALNEPLKLPAEGYALEVPPGTTLHGAGRAPGNDRRA